MRPLIDRISLIGIIAGIITLPIVLCNQIHWTFELFSHGTIHLVYGLIILSLSRILLKLSIKKFNKIVLGFSIILLCWFKFSYLWNDFTASDCNKENMIRIVDANLYSGNKDYNAFKNLILKTDPDIILLQEYTPEWKNQIGSISDYNYKFENPRRGNFGIATFSKINILRDSLIYLENNYYPALLTEIETVDGKVGILNLHLEPPGSAIQHKIRTKQFKQLETFVNSYYLPLLVIGDFNITKYASTFKGLIHNTNLQSWNEECGYGATWPTRLGNFGIAIDHCLTKDIRINSIELGNDIGSDHMPLVIDACLF